MVLLIIILLILAAVAGVLWRVLEIALGVALGIFGAGLLLVVVAYLVLRSRFRRWQRQVQRQRGDHPRGPGDPPGYRELP